MKNVSLCLLFLLSPFVANSQDTDKNVFACQSFYYYTNLGYINENCDYRFIKSIEPNILLATYNKHYCYKDNGTVNCFYSIIYDSTEYEIPCENITLLNSDSIALVSRDSSVIAFRKELAFKLSRAFVLQEKKKELAFLEKLLNPGDPIRILNWSVTESEYLQWPGLEFELLNTSKKTIKYIWITVVGKNRVGDIVTEYGKRTKTVKMIGPVPHFGESSVSFEDVWHTELVSNVEIISIKVQFMDGTFKVINNPKRVILSKEELKYYQKAAIHQSEE